MDEPDQSPKNSLFDELIRKPRFIFWWGLAIAGLSLYAGSWLSRSTIEPVYKVFPIDTVARSESPRLTVSWDGRPVSNLCMAKVAIFNGGEQPLGQEKLPPSDPARIMTSGAIEILSADVIHSSRSSLNVVPTILEGKRQVKFNILNGDALEKYDGVAFRILFTGDCAHTNFSVVGRVVGQPNGFTPAINDQSVVNFEQPIAWWRLLQMGSIILIQTISLCVIVIKVPKMIGTHRLNVYAGMGLHVLFTAVVIFVSLAILKYTNFSNVPWLPK